MKRTDIARVAVLTLSVLSIVLFTVFGGFDLFSLETFQEIKTEMINFYEENTLEYLVYFVAVYLLITAFSLPVGTVLILAGSVVMGWYVVVPVVAVSAAIGALAPFYLARFVLRDWLESKFTKQLDKVNHGLENDGWYYLVATRISAVIPFYAFNVVLGLTEIDFKMYFSSTLVGFAPRVLVYSYAGTQLGDTTSVSEVISFNVFLALAGLALLPLFGRFIQNKVTNDTVTQ